MREGEGRRKGERESIRGRAVIKGEREGGRQKERDSDLCPGKGMERCLIRVAKCLSLLSSHVRLWSCEGKAERGTKDMGTRSHDLSSFVT